MSKRKKRKKKMATKIEKILMATALIQLITAAIDLFYERRRMIWKAQKKRLKNRWS